MTFSRSKAGTAPARPPRQAWVLEPRMMFDAAAVATADAVAAQVIAPTDSAPGIDATSTHSTVTINEGETGFAAMDLFSKVTVSTDTGSDSSGKELTELVITVDRAGANQVLMIDGSEIALKPTTTGSDSTLNKGYSYKVTVSGDTTTITLSIASSEAYQPADVATLIDGIAYKPLDSTVASGDVTVTLKSLSDQDATATLDIHATVTIDNKVNVPPELSGSTLQEAETFNAGTLAKATEIAYSADGSHVYAAGSDNTLTVFSVDSTGRLTQQQSLVVDDLGTVNHLVVSADGKSVYTIAGNGNLIQLSVNDGKLTYVSTTKMDGGGSTGGLAISDDGKQVYVDASGNYGREVYVYNRDENGTLTRIQQLNAHRNGMIATSGDYVYVIHSGAGSFAPHEIKVYLRNATTGLLTQVDDLILTKLGQDPIDYALTTSKDGKLLYVGDPTSANIVIYQRGTDNKLTLINTVTSDKIGSLTLSSDGTQLYAATTTGTVNVYAVGDNGSLTLTGSSTGTTNGGDIAISADGNSILISGNGISRYSPSQTLLRGGEITLAHGLTLSDANNDRLADGNGDYNGTTLTLSRATDAQADDQFGFAQGSGLQLIDGKVMKGDTAIATFSQSAGTLTLTFLAGVSKADANAVLHQVTYSNTGADTNGTLVKLALHANDGKADSQTVTLDVLITNNTAPTLDATTIGSKTYDTHGTVVNPFSNTTISVGEVGQSIIELTLTIDGVDNAANEFIIIAGTRVDLASDSSGQAGDYHYTYSSSYGTGTLVISHEAGVTAAAAQTLVNGIAYVNDTEQATTGTRTITLTSLRDNGGTEGEGNDTGDLAISATIALAINNAPGWQNTITDPDATLYYNNGTLSGYGEYVTAIAVSADGKTLLVSGSDGANAGGNSTLRIYSRNGTSGELTLVQTFIQGENDNPDTATIEANGLSGITTMTMHGNDLYVAGHSGDATTYSLVRFTYDATTGQYTYAGIVATQGVNGATGLDAQITEIVISADGKSLYTINGASSIDGPTGKSALSQFSRDPNTGSLTYLTAYQGGTNELGMNAPSGIVISGDGKSVYVANRSGSMLTLFSRNTETGELTYKGLINNASIIADPDSGERPSGSSYLSELQDIVISPDGAFVYVGSGQQATVSIFSRDASDGSLTYVSTVSLYANVSALNIREMALSSDGSALYVGFNGSVLAVLSRDSTTGVLTYVGKQDVGVRTNHIAVTSDGLNIYSGRSQFTAGLTILSALPHAAYTTNGAATFAEGLNFADVDADQKADYKGTTLTVNRASGASADDQFDFKNGAGLRLENGTIMKGKATIATFTTQDGVLTIAFSRDVDNATANQVLQQVTYLNTNAEAPTRVDLTITVRDSGGKSANASVALLLTETPVAPTLSAEGKQASATITSSGLPDTVDLFNNVDTRLGNAGAAISELTLTVNRASANNALVIDGTTIPLAATEGVTTQGHSYQVTVKDGITTVTLKLNNSDNTPNDVNALIDTIHYKVLSSDVAQGTVTVTLTQLVDAADNTTALDIHSTVIVADTHLTPHLGAEAGALDYGSLFDALNENDKSLFTGIQGITVVGDKIYVVRTHSDWVYDETTSTGQDVESNALYLVERDTDGKLYLTKSAEITDLTGAAQVRVSSDGNSVYVIGADNIALFDANDLHAIGTVGSDLGMVRDVLAQGDKVYITSGDSLLVFTRSGDTLTLSATLNDEGDDGIQLDGANALTLSPDGKTLFVATSGGDTVVSRFSVGDDGTLTYKQAIAGSTASEEGYYASAITVSPDGKSLYVVDNNTSLHIFTVAQDGTLTATSTLTIRSGEGDDGKATSVKQVLVSPDGNSLVITGELGSSEHYNTYGIILYARATDGSLTQRQAVEGFGDLADYNGTVLSEVRYASFSADSKQLYLTGTLNIQNSTSGITPEGIVILDLIPATETFTERGDAVALIPGGILSAPVNDESSYQGATLVIERTGGAQAGDQFGLSENSGLSLKDDGKIWSGDKAIADVTTTASGTLTITFLAGVTQAEAQQVLRAIVYQSTSNDPTSTGTQATFNIRFNDGQDHTADFTTTVSLVGLNDAAVVSTEPVNATYVPGSDAITLFKNTVIDTIEAGQKIHRVEISVSPANVGDVLHVAGGEILLDKTIDYQAFVGESGMEYRVSVSNGVAIVTLYVARDGASTAQLIDGITYSHSNAEATGNRTIGLTLYEDVDWKHPEPQNAKAEFSEKTVITFQGSDVPENAPPVYNDNAGLNLGTLQAGSAYHYTLPENLFTDADNDTLTWRVNGLPAGLSFDAQTRTISGTPTASGEFTLTLTVSDGKAQATHAVEVTVAQAPDVEPDNSAPVYNDQAGLNLGALQAGSAYHYTLPENLFTDADNDTLTWSVSGLPNGLSFDVASRTISGTPTTSGSFTVVLTANDGKAQATHSLNVTVAQAPVEPQPETPDSTTPAPVILTTSSANVPDALKERDEEQPLSAIVAALSQTPSLATAHARLSTEFAAAPSHTAAERTAAPWVLDPVIQTLLPPLETVNFAARGHEVQRDNTPGHAADSSLFQRVPDQTTALESAYSSLQGSLQRDSAGALVFTLPSRLFSARDSGVALSLQLANGRPLPAWIQFDARSGQLRITDPDAVQVNQIQLALTAQAADGTRRTIPVTLQTGHDASASLPTDRGASTALPPLADDSVQGSHIDIALPMGKTAFSEQLSAPHAEQDALLAALSELSRLRA